MSAFTVKFSIDNAAFNPQTPEYEIARVLREIADKIERNGCTGFFETVRDINGNDMGRFALKNDDGTNWSPEQ